MNVGENIPLFDTVPTPPANLPANDRVPVDQTTVDPDQPQADHQRDNPGIPVEPRRSSRTPHPSQAGVQSTEYRQRETTGRGEGQDWATDKRRPQASSAIDWFESTTECEDISACLTETKASHRIPQSYRHAIATDRDRWMVPMRAEIETLKAKHTWDLVRPPQGVNIMDSM